MIAVAEARARILAALPGPAGVEELALDMAMGRVLARPLIARRSQPPVAMSAMDGWAVRAADLTSLPTRLTQIGHLPAGQVFAGTVPPGACVRIFTGAPLPDGTDSVVLQEDCTAEAQIITISTAAAGPAGRWVRAAGMDFLSGSVILEAGRQLTARDLALAAAAGHVWFPVWRRPRVAILASGDEIVRPGDRLGPGQIVSSNALALGAMIRQWGGEPVQLGIAGDTIAALAATAAGARGCDLLVTSGGASAGEHDLVRDALAEGADSCLDFWKIAMRPGKPLMFGRHRGVPFIGLPGNPVAAMVCALLFIHPAVRVLQGLAPETGLVQPARLAGDLPGNDRRADYLRATLEAMPGELPRARAWPVQDSAMLGLFAAADCLVIRPPFAPPAAAGDLVEIIPLAGLV